MSPDELDGLTANLDSVKAQDLIHRGKTSGLSPDQLYDLTMLATGENERQAAAAMAARIRQRQERAIHGLDA